MLLTKPAALFEDYNMNKTILYIAVSLDGLVAGKNDDISWLFRYNDVEYGYRDHQLKDLYP